MNRYGTMAVAALAMLTAACGSKKEAENAARPEGKSMEAVRQEAAKLDRPRPGLYSQTSEVKQIDIPGLPPQMADQMKATLARSPATTFCLSAQEAEKGYQDMFNGVGKGRDCTYSRFAVDRGHLDAQMQCRADDGGQAVLTLTGTVAEDASDITVSMNTTGGQQPGGQMNMTMRVTTKRIGDCH